MKMKDLRKYARQTNIRLFFGGIGLMYLIGIGLVYIIYGQAAAIMGLLCLSGGLLPIILIAGVLWLMDWIVKKTDGE
jgi:hypothetical protein